MHLKNNGVARTILGLLVCGTCFGCSGDSDDAAGQSTVGGTSGQTTSKGGAKATASTTPSQPAAAGGNSLVASGGSANVAAGGPSNVPVAGGFGVGGNSLTSAAGSAAVSNPAVGGTSVGTARTGVLGGGANVAAGGANTTAGGNGPTAAAAGSGVGGGGAGVPSYGGAIPTLGGSTGTVLIAGAPAIETNFIVQSPSGIVDKMDILFSIDNSLSMGDKQQVLAAAVPQLLRRLTAPDCVDPTPGSRVAPVPMADPTSPCPSGMEREFAPIKDIHIGIVTSSLGDFGGDTCPLPEDDPKGAANSPQNAAQNDHAWLVGALPRTSSDGLPMFLKWSKEDAADYAATIDTRLTEFKNLVVATTELGCGNEMPLEAWYRFLVDPKPPIDVAPPKDADGKQSSGADVRGPVDSNILSQRKAFLRPDSLVGVVMLSDENDCSMRDDSYSWVTMTFGQGFRMWRGSSVCATNPNDPCCFSCMLQTNVSQECLNKDTSCRQGDPDGKLSAADDDLNIRCRSMKKRFGFDFLFPTTRYVNALTKLQLCPDQTYGDLDCDCTAAKAKGIACTPGTPVPNPLFENLDPAYVPTGPMRLDASSVFLAGIVGVPWQDLATEDSLAAGVPLKLRLATELDWDLFAPKDDTTPPLDPLMIEQFEPRVGTHPITGAPVMPPESARMANPINGHEWYTSKKDVQFACIFSLEQPISAGKTTATRVCDLEKECGKDDGSAAYKRCFRRFDGCSCVPTQPGATTKSALDPTVTLSPLCQGPDGNPSSTQYFAKAYPGLRELEVLRGFYDVSTFSRNNAIAASICPKDLNYANNASPGYGYNPAMRALVERLKDNIGGTCLPQPLVSDAATGKLPCSMIEAITPQGKAEGSCDCEAKQRDPVDPATQATMRAILEQHGSCSGESCGNFCFCSLRQLLPGTAAGDACLNDVNATRNTNPPGFCYIDPPKFGNPTLVSDCAATEKRTIRIVGNDAMGLKAPAKGPVFYSCSGSPYAPGATQ